MSPLRQAVLQGQVQQGSDQGIAEFSASTPAKQAEVLLRKFAAWDHMSPGGAMPTSLQKQRVFAVCAFSVSLVKLGIRNQSLLDCKVEHFHAVQIAWRSDPVFFHYRPMLCHLSWLHEVLMDHDQNPYPSIEATA